MITVWLTFELLGYWHVGSGRGSGAAEDASVIKTPDGWPYVPGKAVKGLVREAAQTLEEAGGDGEGREKGCRFHFSQAV